VIIRTVRLIALVILSASVHLVVKRMILLFFPAMRELAPVFIFASVSICLHEMFCFPLRALFSFILKYMRFSSEILPVVSIHAGISSVRSIAVGTPDCFKVEHVEICMGLFLFRGTS
jgi:hypothetical protein